MGDSFSTDNGNSRPTPPTSTIKQRVPEGTLSPASLAITSTDFPTIPGFKERCGVATTLASWSASAAERKCPPCALTWSLTAFSTGASQTTACSEAQMVPLSKVFPVKMSCTALGTSAVLSMKTGTFPGPTPNAGFPDEYAARTSPMPPVARMTAVCLCFIQASVPSIVAVVLQASASAGKPSLIAASRINRTVSLIQRAAEGCGESTIAFLYFIPIQTLKNAVECGLVEGMMPATTPLGLAISTTSFDSETTPTVRKPRK